MDQSITFKLPSELRAQLMQEAEREHRTVSQQIRLILEKHYRSNIVTTLGHLGAETRERVLSILNEIPGLNPDRCDLIARHTPSEDVLSGRFLSIYQTPFGRWFYGEADFWRIFDRTDAQDGWNGALVWLSSVRHEVPKEVWTDEFNRRWDAAFDEWYEAHLLQKRRAPKSKFGRRAEACYEGWKGLLAQELEPQP